MNLSALSRPVTGDAVREYRRSHPEPVDRTALVRTVTRTVITVAIAVTAGFVLSAIATVMSEIVLPGTAAWAGGAVWVILLATGVVVTWVIVNRWYARGVRRYRLAELADDNGWIYEPFPDSAHPPGMLFTTGDRTTVLDSMRRIGSAAWEAGTLEYLIDADESSKTRRWGFLACRLAAPLPHIVLDAVGNNGLWKTSNLPLALARDQRLSLEGDFDRHFTLYCPTGYERDALYLFTPDIMARFIDLGGADADISADVEIVDDWLLIYLPREIVTLDAADWEWVEATSAALTVKLDQWARWRDERSLPAGGATDGAESHPAVPGPAPRPVAAAGRRLRRRQYTWAGIALLVLIGGWMLWDWVSGIVAAVSP